VGVKVWVRGLKITNYELQRHKYEYVVKQAPITKKKNLNTLFNKLPILLIDRQALDLEP
jgi:hypothetical protein